MAKNIKDKKGKTIGKVSNSKEQMWEAVVENLKNEIESNKRRQTVNEAFLKEAKKQLKKAGKS